MRKGQYRIIMEVMLFGIGVAITSFVLVSFQDLQKNAESISVKNQMDSVMDSVLNGIVKASLTKNAIVRVPIPTDVSSHVYKIFVQNNKNLTAIDLKDATINVSRQIFNIDAPNNRITGEVVSSGGIAEITYDGAKVIIQRG